MIQVHDTLYFFKLILRLYQFRVQQVLSGGQHFQIIGGRMLHQQFRFPQSFLQGSYLLLSVVKAYTG